MFEVSLRMLLVTFFSETLFAGFSHLRSLNGVEGVEYVVKLGCFFGEDIRVGKVGILDREQLSAG